MGEGIGAVLFKYVDETIGIAEIAFDEGESFLGEEVAEVAVFVLAA